MVDDGKNEAEDLKPAEEEPKKSRKAAVKKSAAKKRTRKYVDKLVEYEGEKYRGVEIDGDGRLLLKEKYYNILTMAEQRAKLCEKDLELARLKEAAYRREVESRLPLEVQREMANLASRVQEANERLAITRKQYRDEAQGVRDETGLELKKWLIDDMRRMRHVDRLT